MTAGGRGERSEAAVAGEPWHARTVAEVEAELCTDAERGLSQDEVRRRLELHGRNALEEKGETPLWLLFLQQFQGVLILVLFGAAVLAAAIADWIDAAVI